MLMSIAIEFYYIYTILLHRNVLIGTHIDLNGFDFTNVCLNDS